MKFKKGLGAIIIFAPFIFTIHFLEESRGFVSWFNTHVSRGITQNLFWSVNITALVITLIVVVIELIESSVFSASLIIVWFSFLMLANAIFHITGSIIDGHCMPGLITAIILYVPYYLFVIIKLLRRERIKIGWLIVLTIIGSSLMLIYGWLIIFRGSRLF